MKILFSPFSDPVTDSELNGLREICLNVKPDRLSLCFPDNFSPDSLSDEQKKLLLALNEQYDVAITYYDDEAPESAAAFLRNMCADCPDDEIHVNHLSGTEAVQAALLPLLDDASLNLAYAGCGTETDEPEAETDQTEAEPEPAADAPAADEAKETEAPENTAQDPDAVRKEAVTGFGKELLKELIDSYDYHGALILSRKLQSDIPEIVPFLLEAADMRSDGRFAEANQMFRRCGLEGIMTGQQQLAEYFLLLDLYVKQERYTDFLRAIQPFLLEIMIAAIRKQFDTDITRYMIYGSRRWDENKLVLEQMTGKFNETFAYHTKPKPCKAGGYVTTAHLSNLMENLSVQRKHAGLILDNMKLRLNAEERVRTLAFYNMQGVTAQDIEKVCACRPEDIVTMLLNYVRNYTDIILTDEMLRSYLQMNEMITSYL